MAMAMAMVSASTGAMGSVLAKLDALLAADYKLLKGMEDDIKALKAELEKLHPSLQKLSDLRDPDRHMRSWMTEVRDLSYEVELFILRVDSVSRSKPQDLMASICSAMRVFTWIPTRYWTAKEIDALKARALEASKKHAERKFDEAVSEPPEAPDAMHDSEATDVAIGPRLSALRAERAERVEIDGPANELVRLLTKGGSRSAQQLKVVAIVGMGGSGKTFLASQVYRKLGGQFDCQAFVLVSTAADPRKIFKSLLSQLVPQEHVDREAWDEDEFISSIREFLKDKRYFIVVDDLWSTSVWRSIEIALPNNNCGSIILITTRMRDVAKSCCSLFDGFVYEMGALSFEESRKLFLERIFSDSDAIPIELERISHEILKRCAGLPLAITTIASLLAGKSKTVSHWQRVLDSIGSSLEKGYGVEEMKRVLSLSYDDLPSYLKACLLDLSTFPEDYEIERDRLVKRWMAEGFIDAVGEQNLQKAGEMYFMELIDRSMIQPVGIKYNDQPIACRVHDVILDLIISKAVEENFITFFGDQRHSTSVLPQMKIRRLSLNFCDQEHLILPSTLNLSHIRSLTIFGYAEQMPSLSYLRLLRVLDLQGCQKLENHHLQSIEIMFCLKYLGLRKTQISELPAQIGKLRLLETLDLRGTNVKKLPSSIVQLHMLVYLLVDFVTLPVGIGKMQALQELSIIEIDRSCSVQSVQELSNLSKLRTLRFNWCLDDGRSDIENYRQSLTSSLSKLAVRSLSIDSGGCSLDFLLDSWSPYSLQIFEMRTDYCFPRIPLWITSAETLTYLDIRVNQVRQEDIRVFGALSALLLLNLFVDNAPEEKLTVGSMGFQNLKVLSFSCRRGIRLMFEAGAMPKLEKLYLLFNARETKNLYGGFDFGIELLSRLKEVIVKIDCEGAQVLDLKAAVSAIRRAADIHPNHPECNIHRLNAAGKIIEEEEEGNQTEDSEDE